MPSKPPSTRRQPPQSDSYAPPPVPEARVENSTNGNAGAVSGSELSGHHVKFESIGSGPFFTVYKGRNNALEQETCVKEMRDLFGYFSFLRRADVLSRLKQELCAQAQIRHPCVVSLLDQNTDLAQPFFVTELLTTSLRQRLDQAEGKGLPVAAAVRNFLQLCYGLQAAHAQGLTHHNLKPENILFDGHGNAKVGDFGLSRLMPAETSVGSVKVFVASTGTAYLPPELVGGASEAANASADVYSLGILWYEMVTGGLPGRRSPLPSKVNSEFPSKLDAVFDRMTRDRQSDRYPDFNAVLNDFYSAFSAGQYLGRGDLVLWSSPPAPRAIL